MQYPYLHPIEHLEYLVDHQLLVMVQPLIHSGSLKDMIYKVTACSQLVLSGIPVHCTRVAVEGLKPRRGVVTWYFKCPLLRMYL